jgi:hypothetical protein
MQCVAKGIITLSPRAKKKPKPWKNLKTHVGARFPKCCRIDGHQVLGLNKPRMGQILG